MNAYVRTAFARVVDSLEAALGPDLLAYVLACPRSELRELGNSVDLSPGQTSVAALLTQIVNDRLPLETDEANRPYVVRALLMQTDEGGVPVARRLHDQANGTPSEQEPDAEIEGPLASLARDSYPAFLLPPDEHLPLPGRDEVNFLATSLLFRHPAAERFSAHVLEDARLFELFSETESSGWSTFVYSNSGRGGGLQLVMLPELILRNAWQKLAEEERSPESFVAHAVKVWRLVRDVLTGETRSTLALVSFTGVLLPSGARVEVGEGVLREATSADRRIAPESLKQQLSGTDARGESTTINYDGDVIFEVEIPYRVVASPPPPPGAPATQWPAGLQPPHSLERSLTRLRASLVFAVQRDHRVQAVPAWRYIDDPLSWGYALSWFDPRNAIGLVPTALTEEDVVEWVKWYRLLDTPRVDRIEIALTRVLRAIGERREPSDVLIDSVIAWENLFGTSEGEPTLRVTASLALLLEADPQERRDLRTRLAKIYSLRSKMVHGSHVLAPTDYPLCYEALTMALRAIRTLIEARPDVLELGDGGARSLQLILEG